MIFDKHSSLKKVYYQSFLLLILGPILLIFLTAMSVIGVMMRTAAVDNITGFQDNIRNSLTEDVKEASLQLSHFVYVNNSIFMQTAASMDTDDVNQRYVYGEALEQAFQTAMVPNQDIVAGKFYLRSGRTAVMKEDIVLTDEEVKGSAWYREALAQKNEVKLGSYDTTRQNITYSTIRRGQLVLAVALSPDVYVDKTEKIEMVTLFTVAKAGDIIRQGKKKERLGTTVLLDEDDEVIYGDFGDEKCLRCVEGLTDKSVGVHTQSVDPDGEGGGKYTFIVSKVPQTGWRIVTFVRTGSLTEDFNRLALLVFFVICALMGLFYLFSRYFLKNIVDPVHSVVEGMREVEDGCLETHLEPEGQSEIRTMIHSFNRMTRNLKTSIEENESAQRKKHEAEVKALQSQINPHFLVNTLNSIRFMAQVAKFDGIRRMAEALIRILSCSFRSNISFYTVREELEVLDSYIYLMKIRYSDGFEVVYQVDEDCLDDQIPRLLLQPVVENSIVHGLAEKEDEIGLLTVSVRKDEGYLCLAVEDNGRGMTREEINSVLGRQVRKDDDNYHIGIENVLSRLRLYFKEDCSLEIDSRQGEYTRTVIKIPLTAGKGEERTDE